VIFDLETDLVLSADQAEGSVHDFQIYKDHVGSAVSPDVQAKTDCGYQGIASYQQ